MTNGEEVGKKMPKKRAGDADGTEPESPGETPKTCSIGHPKGVK